MSLLPELAGSLAGMSDETLVRTARAGDRSAFAELVERHRNTVFGVAYNLLGDFGLSEDIAQQTFVTAWTRKLDLDDPSRVAAWLCGIARNLARNQRRRKAVESAVPLTDQFASRDSLAVDEQIMAREEAALLWSILEKIPEIYREPMILHYRQDADTAEVAAALDISEELVRTRLSRGRKLLEQQVAAFVEGTLSRQTTSPTFVPSVLLALPAGTKGTGLAATLMAKLGISAGAVLGPLIGLAGSIYGSRRSFAQATSDVERRFLWRMVGMLSLLIGGFFVLQFGLWFWSRAIWSRPWVQGTIWGSYSVLLGALIAFSNHRLRTIKLEHGTAEERVAIERPVSISATPTKATWNLFAGISGCTAWMFVAAIHQRDWLGLFLVASLLLIVSVVFLPRMSKARDAARQMRTNWQALAVTILGTLLVVAIRWSAWMDVLLSR